MVTCCRKWPYPREVKHSNCGANHLWTCTSGFGSSMWQIKKRSWRGRKNSVWRKQDLTCTGEFSFLKTNYIQHEYWVMNSDSRIWFQSSREISHLINESNLACGNSLCWAVKRQYLLLFLFQLSVETIYHTASRHCSCLLSHTNVPWFEVATYRWCRFQSSGIRKCTDPFRLTDLSEWSTFSTFSGVNDDLEVRWISRWPDPQKVLVILIPLCAMTSQKTGILFAFVRPEIFFEVFH